MESCFHTVTCSCSCHHERFVWSPHEGEVSVTGPTALEGLWEPPWALASSTHFLSATH